MQAGYRLGYAGRAYREGSSSCWKEKVITHNCRQPEEEEGACTAKGWIALPEAAVSGSEVEPRETIRAG